MPAPDLDGRDFGEFVAATLSALLRFGQVLTGNPEEAEDLVHEALARSLRRWRRVSANDPVAYVLKVMVNTHLTRWRRWGSRVVLGPVPEPAIDDAAVARSQDWDLLRRALAELPARQRAVLVLRYLEDLPDAVIADLLGCQPGTVRSQASRGLATLRPLLAMQPAETGAGGETHAG
ncbi:MAG: SigE family RNA polymerase sigma factor [Streptosporangiaceae bacterium]